MRPPPAPDVPGVAERVQDLFPDLVLEGVVLFVPRNDETFTVLFVHL